ncbi:hypothetical protein DWW69_17840, partial [Bacteroides sp. AF16-49]
YSRIIKFNQSTKNRTIHIFNLHFCPTFGVQFIKKAPSLQPIIAHAVTSKSEEVNVKNTILKYA